MIRNLFSILILPLAVLFCLSCGNNNPVTDPDPDPDSEEIFIVSTLAGKDLGSSDGTGEEAEFRYPQDIALDNEGNFFVADGFGHLVRKITPSGKVTTIAGSGKEGFKDGAAEEAQFFFLTGIALDKKGNIYVTDFFNDKIRKIDPSGEVTTFAGADFGGFADAPASEARFIEPGDLITNNDGSIYVSDTYNSRIRIISPSGMVSTLAGSEKGYSDGVGTDAQFGYQWGITLDSENNIIVADWSNNRIRKVTPERVVSTIAGTGERGFADGNPHEAEFNRPMGVATDDKGNIYITDHNNHSIRKIDATGNVTTIAGTGEPGFGDGIATEAQSHDPSGLLYDKKTGSLIVADSQN